MEQSIILAGGCFWCIDSAFRHIEGVKSVSSGYIGGSTKNPTYASICTGNTGHAEAIKVTYDENIIPLEQILLFFFKLHDPTTLNRQGADVGTQYRSAIFYSNNQIKSIAEAVIFKLDNNGSYSTPIVTTLEEESVFYPAEDYHQDYFAKNPQNAYCQAVIAPKLSHFFNQKN